MATADPRPAAVNRRGHVRLSSYADLADWAYLREVFGVTFVREVLANKALPEQRDDLELVVKLKS